MPSLKLIIWVTVVLRGKVVGDWRFDHQAPVVQKVDNAIHRLNNWSQATYIGETGRNSTTLRNEDKRTTKNKIAEHHLTNCPKVLSTSSHTLQTITLEIMLIIHPATPLLT